MTREQMRLQKEYKTLVEKHAFKANCKTDRFQDHQRFCLHYPQIKEKAAPLPGGEGGFGGAAHRSRFFALRRFIFKLRVYREIMPGTVDKLTDIFRDKRRPLLIGKTVQTDTRSVMLDAYFKNIRSCNCCDPVCDAAFPHSR